MGVIGAIVGVSRAGQSATARNTSKTTMQAVQDVTLHDGLRQMLETIQSLVELDNRLEEVEQDLIGHSPVSLERLPSPEDLGLEGFVPRLMEAALLIGAMGRRMHLRVGVIEGAVGRRARPVTEASMRNGRGNSEAAGRPEQAVRVVKEGEVEAPAARAN